MNFNCFLKNIQAQQRVCNCGLHRGELLQEINAQLINGKPIRILRDPLDPPNYYRVAVGDPYCLGDHSMVPAVNELEVEAIILEQSNPRGWEKYTGTVPTGPRKCQEVSDV